MLQREVGCSLTTFLSLHEGRGVRAMLLRFVLYKGRDNYRDRGRDGERDREREQERIASLGGKELGQTPEIATMIATFGESTLDQACSIRF